MSELDDNDDDFFLTVPLEEKHDNALYSQNTVLCDGRQGQTVNNKSVSSRDDQIKNLRAASRKREDEDENEKEDIPLDRKVQIPSHFPFPFEPYDIQKGFMSKLYECLDLGKIGIFESPTGTGKSLSVICGALKWLRDYQEQQRAELERLEKLELEMKSTNANDNELDWISEFKQKKEKEEELKKVIEEQEVIRKHEMKVKELKSDLKVKVIKRKRTVLEDEFDDLMKSAPKDLQKAYQDEVEETENKSEIFGDGNKDDELILDYDSDNETDVKDDYLDDKEEHVTKIYFCSRTHSQLSQFVREVIKSPYGDDIRVVSLGSRQNLCINSSVTRLKALSLINEVCLDLQKNKKIQREPSGEATAKRKNKGAACPYYRQEAMNEFKDKVLLEAMDMEHIVSSGKQMKACPYYGTRYAVPLAELVVLPYNTLLHKSTREACGIKLEGNVVIIDEAHNLLETINNIHSVEVTGSQLLRAHSQLTQYENRYRSRLKAKNLLYIKQILFILSCLVKCIDGKIGIPGDKQTTTKTETKLVTVNSFLEQSLLDNINLFKILMYCKASMISKKLNGFAEKYQDAEVMISKEEKKSGVSNFLREITHGDKKSNEAVTEVPKQQEENVVLRSPLMHIEGFLDALTSADKDGRIVVNRQSLVGQSSLKFLLLNPAVHFTDIVKNARAVVVAGGTMQPIDEFKDQLFLSAGVAPQQVMEYSCGHVIPEDNLRAFSVESGPSGVSFDFTFQSRENPKLLTELGNSILNVCQIVPGGIVCFFPSYDYQRLVYTHWERSGTLLQISRKKRIFQEPKRAGFVDKILDDYTRCVQKNVISSAGSLTGAILFSVVGGKMSEGINFSDDLGRMIIMVGMPYPNIKSPELQEKMTYLNTNFKRDNQGRQPGQIHYENICMKAVNQSIGRAIRHRGDYAVILLLDRRYGRESVSSKLPEWITKCLIRAEKYGQVLSNIAKFFVKHKSH